MPSAEKKEKVKQIKKWFDSSESILVLRYRGLKVSEANELRSVVGKNDAELRVFKNTLTRIALEGTRHEQLSELIDGPVAVVFASSEPAAVAKVLRDYSKGRKEFHLLGGWFQDTLITDRQVEAIATLPSREVLLARMLGQAAAPLSGLVGVCAGPLRKLLTLFQAIKDKAPAGEPEPGEEEVQEAAPEPAMEAAPEAAGAGDEGESEAAPQPEQGDVETTGGDAEAVGGGDAEAAVDTAQEEEAAPGGQAGTDEAEGDVDAPPDAGDDRK